MNIVTNNSGPPKIIWVSIIMFVLLIGFAVLAALQPDMDIRPLLKANVSLAAIIKIYMLHIVVIMVSLLSGVGLLFKLSFARWISVLVFVLIPVSMLLSRGLVPSAIDNPSFDYQSASFGEFMESAVFYFFVAFFLILAQRLAFSGKVREYLFGANNT